MLNFSRQEWERLPWTNRRMYLEEMAADVQGNGEPGESPADAHLPDPTYQSTDELAAQGFTARRV